MLCHKCESKLDTKANFCSECGWARLNAPEESHSQEHDSPVLVVRPEFVTGLTWLRQTPVLVFFCLWSILSFGTFLSLVLHDLDVNIPASLIIIIVFVLIASGMHIAQSKTYSESIYTFYTNRLEYVEGFLRAEKKIVEYKRVTECRVIKGVFQKKYGLGSVILSVPASDYNSKNTGIKIRDIQDADAIYQQVKKLIG